MAQATYPELLSQGLGSEPSPARPACKQVSELCSCLVLLPMGVAWPSHCCERRWSLTPPFHPCQLPGSLFLWPCPEGYPSPGVIRHRALRSADFPRFHQRQNRDHPTNLGASIIPFSLVRVKIIKAEKVVNLPGVPAFIPTQGAVCHLEIIYKSSKHKAGWL